MKTVGIIRCSDPLSPASRSRNEALVQLLEDRGCRVLRSPLLYEEEASGARRAEELMALFRNPEVTDILDISGGDMACEVLDFLDYEEIGRARFWGYSDLTTVVNAIYTRTGKKSVLFPVKNLLNPEVRQALFCPEFRMVRGRAMEGILVGGNIRCFLKLAGTPYFPDLTDRLLLLEARSGGRPQMISYLSQLRSCGAFEKLRGVVLGTFTQLGTENMLPLVASFTDKPIAVTPHIGHGADARAVVIGEMLRIPAPCGETCGNCE